MKKTLLTTLALAGTILTPALRAEEGGSAHYMPGATASFIDALPGEPNKLAIADIVTYYSGDANGARPLDFGGQLTLGANATVYANTLAVIYQTPWHILGGGYTVGAAVPYMWMDIKATVVPPIGPTKKVDDSTSGLGDVVLYPFMLGWKKGDLKYDVRLGVYTPTGPYDAGQLANTGRNYWTLEPSASFSWLSTKIGTEVSVYTGFDINSENHATDYKSGASVHIDGTVAQHFPLLGGFGGVGANAFYYQQITRDSGSGATLGDFEGRTAGVGPVLSYAHKIGKRDLAVEVKWLPELDTKRRLQGDYVWVKVGLIF